MKNVVTLLGRLAADPLIEQIDGAPRATLQVVTEETWIDRGSGQKRTQQIEHRVIVHHDGAARGAQRLLRKGSLVDVTGMLVYVRPNGSGPAAEVHVRAPHHAVIFVEPEPGRERHAPRAQAVRPSRG